jgi:hypothetical protein
LKYWYASTNPTFERGKKLFAAGAWALMLGFWYIASGSIISGLFGVTYVGSADSFMAPLTPGIVLYGIGFVLFIAACVFGCIWGCSCYCQRDYSVVPVPETENCCTRNCNKKLYAVFLWLLGGGLMLGGLSNIALGAVEFDWVTVTQGFSQFGAGFIVWIPACFVGCWFGCTCGCCCKDDNGENDPGCCGCCGCCGNKGDKAAVDQAGVFAPGQ